MTPGCIPQRGGGLGTRQVLLCHSVDCNIGHYSCCLKGFRITKQCVFVCSALVCWEWTEQEKPPLLRCWLEMSAQLMAQHRSGIGMGKLIIQLFVNYHIHAMQNWGKSTLDIMKTCTFLVRTLFLLSLFFKMLTKLIFTCTIDTERLGFTGKIISFILL